MVFLHLLNWHSFKLKTLQNHLLNQYLNSFCYSSPNMPALSMIYMKLVEIQMPQIWQMLGTLHVWRMELNLDSMNSFFGSPYPHPYFKASVISLWELQLAESRTSKDRPWLNWTTVVFCPDSYGDYILYELSTLRLIFRK